MGTSFPLFHETIPACSVQVCGGCCTCGQCGPGQRRGQTPLRHQRPQTWRVGGGTAQLYSTHLSSPSVSPGLLVLGTCAARPMWRPPVCLQRCTESCCVVNGKKEEWRKLCPCPPHLNTSIYLPTTFYAQIKARYPVDTTNVAHTLLMSSFSVQNKTNRVCNRKAKFFYNPGS